MKHIETIDNIDNTAVWVVMPAYNEERKIRSTIAGVLERGYSLIVVDDGSSDATFEAAGGTGAHRCRHLVNQGAGAALQTGIDYALQHHPKAILTFDSDGQHDPDDIAEVVRPVLEGTADVVLGTRFAGADLVENMPSMRRALLKAAVLLTRLTTGLKVSDTHNGFKAFSVEAVQRIRIRQNRMAHASEILAQIAAYKFRYMEVPVHIHYTEYSMQKGQRNSNAFNILWESFTGGLWR